MAIRQATRKGTKAIVGFVGQSGSGKTYSALLFAKGMAKGDMSKVVIIDTENRRSEMYADDPIIGGFNVLTLDPPYSPQRYTSALKECEEAGFPVIVIDSITHEWNNTGGVLEMVDKGTSKSDFANWAKPKKEHNRFVNELLRTKAHIVLSFRGKEKYKQVKSGNKSEVVSEGLQPIQDNNLIFEMTMSILLEDTLPHYLKAPSVLRHIVPEGKRITEEAGLKLVEWIDSAEKVNAELEVLKSRGREAALDGMDALREWFVLLSPQDRILMEEFKDELKDELEKIGRGADEVQQTIAQPEQIHTHDAFQ